MKHTILLFASLVLTIGCKEDAPELPPANRLPAFAQNLLHAHNEWRTQVGVDSLEWEEGLAKKAKELLDSEGCLIRENEEDLGQNGIYTIMDAAGRAVVETWALPKTSYNYEADTCQLLPEVCDSYKQIVWANSKKLGCAKVICVDGSSSLWVCLYDPKGNVPGERPY